MSKSVISDTIISIGVDDTSLDLFEGQYPIPHGVSYNSYVILDEKTAVMDTVDSRKSQEWLENLSQALKGRHLDYVVVQHMEPDHSGTLESLLQKYPEVQVVGNAKTFPMIDQFMEGKLSEDRKVAVKEGDTLSLGAHTLQFVMAPMVHWPEVMVSYEQSEKVLFSADAFGTFGALCENLDWIEEGRRYYINIVGKYGMPVQTLLKKAAGLDISMICPLHGPVLKENLGFYLEKYQTWSSYMPETKGVVIAYASIYGNTGKAAKKLAEILKAKGEEVKVFDLARDMMSSAVEAAFQYDRLVLACSTYDGGMFPCMEDFLHHLKAKMYQKRTVAYIQNGTWAPVSEKAMKAVVAEMKEITEIPVSVTIRSTMKEETVKELEALAEALMK